MAATTFKNVQALTIAGVSISEPISITIDYDGALQTDKTDGASFVSAIGTGAKTRTISVTARDPKSLLSARGASGTCSFSLLQGCDASGLRAFSLGTGIAANFSFESGDPGDLGTASIDVQLTGDTFTAT